MKKIKTISNNVNGLGCLLKSLADDLEDLQKSLDYAIRSNETIEDDLDKVISAEDNISLDEKVWEKNNLDKVEFVSAMLGIAKEIYDNLPEDENFDFRIKVAERRVKY